VRNVLWNVRFTNLNLELELLLNLVVHSKALVNLLIADSQFGELSLEPNNETISQGDD
jgi:hypothetical protein